MSFALFWGLNRIFPPHGLGLESPFIEDEVIYGSTPLGKEVEGQAGEKRDSNNVVATEV